MGGNLKLDLIPKFLMVSNATSVSFKDAGGVWNSIGKKSMTYSVEKQEKLVEKIMQHCSGHNNDEGIRQVPNII